MSAPAANPPVAPANAAPPAAPRVRFQPPAPPTAPETYEGLYNSRGDGAQGDYTGFYADYSNDRITGPQFLARMANVDQTTVPLVFLCLTSANGHDYIRAVHRPTAFKSNLVDPTEWDNKCFCIEGERMDDIANVYPFPRDAFGWVQDTPVPRCQEIDTTINSTTNPFDDSSFIAPIDPIEPRATKVT